MKLETILAAVRSPWGRVAGVAVGLSAVGVLVAREGAGNVLHSAEAAAGSLPWVFALEAAILACDMLAIRALYGADSAKLSVGLLVRGGCLGYAMQALVPAGRAVAEAARATLFAPRVGAARAAGVALQIQGAALVANCVTSLVCAWGASSFPGGAGIAWATLGNAALTAVGAALLLGGSRLRLGALVGRVLPRAKAFGEAFDRNLNQQAVINWAAIAWETLGRGLQVVQNGVLVVAVGGVLGLLPALLSEAIHLVGTTVGDLVPAQLGATEAYYHLFAAPLGLTESSSVAIGLTAHLAQLLLLVVCLLWMARPLPPNSPTSVAAVEALP